MFLAMENNSWHDALRKVNIAMCGHLSMPQGMEIHPWHDAWKIVHNMTCEFANTDIWGKNLYLFPIGLDGVTWWIVGIHHAFSQWPDWPMRHLLHFITFFNHWDIILWRENGNKWSSPSDAPLCPLILYFTSCPSFLAKTICLFWYFDKHY